MRLGKTYLLAPAARNASGAKVNSHLSGKQRIAVETLDDPKNKGKSKEQVHFFHGAALKSARK